MVISLTILISIISTIIVIMSSIFWCCWSKKGSADFKEKKSKTTKEEPTNDKFTSRVNVAGKPENGVTAEIPRASQCELRLPLLSSDAMDGLNENLGDFSAVQRETEILRPYRKPPPPKRARQTRVPRMVKSGTNDIFTELHDEDAIHSSDKENDEVDSVLLRQDNEKSKRDTRSSMLTEIEQTIAALHMAEQSTTSPVADLLHEDKFIIGLTQEDPKMISNTKTAHDWRNSTGSVGKRSSSQLSLSSEIKPEPAFTAKKDSPKISPIAKPRIGPKVSPKPSPKVRSKLRGNDNTTTATTTLKEPTDNLVNASFISSLELKMNSTRGSDTGLEVYTQPQSMCLEKEAPLVNVGLPDTTIRAVIDVHENAVITNINSNLGLTKSSESPSGAAHENLEFTEEQKHEDKMNSSSSSSSFENTVSSEATKTLENVVADTAIGENTVKEFRKSVSVEKKEEDSQLGNQKLNKSISVEKEDSHFGTKKLNKSISVEKEDSLPGNQKLNKSISVEKEDLYSGSQNLRKSVSVEKEDSHVGTQKLNKSISVEKEDSHHAKQKLNTSISVDKEDSLPGNQKLNKSISVEKEDSHAGTQNLIKSVSVEKEDSHHVKQKFNTTSISVEKEDSHPVKQKLNKSISVEKEDSHAGTQKLNKSISVEKEDLHPGNQNLSKSVSVEKEDSHPVKQKLNTSISVEKEDSHPVKQKLNTSISVEKEDSHPVKQKLNTSISVEKEDSHLGNKKFSKSISVEKEDSHPVKQKLNKSISVEKEEQIRSEGQTFISNGKETVHSVINDQATHNGTDKLTTTGMKDESAEGAAQQSSPDRETQSSQNDGATRGRSQETGKQRRESSEDQTGKGKISKIPVRAGSKPRTSPPKLTSGDKASSPTN